MDDMSNRESPGQIEIMKMLDEVVNGNYVEIDERGASDDRERRIVEALNRLSKRQRSMVTTFEQNIRKSERRFRDIIENTPVGICITNRDRIFEYVNPTYCRLYGYEASELLGQPFTMVVPDEYVERLEELHDEFMGRRYELRGEWKVQKKDGGFLDILADAAYIVDVDSQPKKVTFVVDITDRKLAEDRLEETISELHQQIEERKRVESVKQQVERIIRHDLRNPLNGILGAAQLLDRYDLPDEQRQLVQMILQSGHKLNEMLSTSIDIVRMEEGQYVLDPIEIDLRSVIDETVAELNQLASEQGVAFSVESTVDQAPVDGEKLYLGNLFANLLRNAVEAGPEGSTISIRIEPADEGAFEKPDSYRVVIHNEQVVPAEIRERLFDRYVTYGKPDGSGIGTYVARLIARVHGGDISFDTSEQAGTNFYVVLPRAKGIIQPRQVQ